MSTDKLRDQNTNDTMPRPADVEAEFFAKTTDDNRVSALDWLAAHDINPAPIKDCAGSIASIQWTVTWDLEVDRYRFHIYEAAHVGPKHDWHIAVPLILKGVFTDLLLLNASFNDFTTACGKAKWLGQIGCEKAIRLHRDPIDWLEAGCQGVCHLEPISRQALKDLRAADKILCNDIHTALEAWEWGFGADDDDLTRFVIDAAPENIRYYFERQARHQAWSAIHARANA